MVDEAIELLKKLEWSGRTTGPGSYQGATDGDIFPSCPICHGLQPRGKSGLGYGGFIASAFGHKKNCELARLVR